VERIASLVSELNGRLLTRLWQLLAPPALVATSCLVVLGSEGRGEQILKTDQDNALILADAGMPLSEPELAAVARSFSDALALLGWPPCPGDVMLTNPLWPDADPVDAHAARLGARRGRPRRRDEPGDVR
jgi:CBS domain-containing protein